MRVQNGQKSRALLRVLEGTPAREVCPHCLERLRALHKNLKKQCRACTPASGLISLSEVPPRPRHPLCGRSQKCISLKFNFSS